MSGSLQSSWLEDFCSSPSLLDVKYEQCLQATLTNEFGGWGHAHYTRMVNHYAMALVKHVCFHLDNWIGWKPLHTLPSSRMLASHREKQKLPKDG